MHLHIADNLWQVGGDELSAPGDAAVYLLRCGGSAALVDAGTGAGHRRLIQNIAQCLPPDIPIAYLLLTHCHYDHTCGAKALQAHYGCPIVAHALDAVYLESGDSQVTAAAWYGATFDPLIVDVKLEDDVTKIPVGDNHIRAIHWPGHSPGSLIYTTVLDGQLVLFGQDVHGPIHPALRSDARQYQGSLKKMHALGADLLLEGHFGVIRGKAAVRQFIESYIQP